MAVSFGKLEPRQMERLRGELGEILLTYFTYPPFFDYTTGQIARRPPGRRQREAIEQYLRAVNFGALENVEIALPEIRRFIERLVVRYVETTPLAGARFERRLASLRARAPRAAAALQRDLLAYLSGTKDDFGAPRPAHSWGAAPGATGMLPRMRTDADGRRLQAALLGQSETSLAQRQTVVPAVQQCTEAVPSRSAAEWEGTQAALPITTAATHSGTIAGTDSPFAGLEAGAQSAMFAAARATADLPTSPLPVIAPPALDRAHGSNVSNASSASVIDSLFGDPALSDLPPDLYALYGDFLREPKAATALPQPSIPAPQAAEADSQVYAVPERSAATPPWLLHSQAGDAAQQEPAHWLVDSAPPTRKPFQSSTRESLEPLVPQPAPPPLSASPALPATENDTLIFAHLRYQIEAYIRRAARSYGVASPTANDPAQVLDALRRSGLVDDADMRIAETLLAVAERVAARGQATLEDYRQAMLLYLLYHRGHLGA